MTQCKGVEQILSMGGILLAAAIVELISDFGREGGGGSSFNRISLGNSISLSENFYKVPRKVLRSLSVN